MRPILGICFFKKSRYAQKVSKHPIDGVRTIKITNGIMNGYFGIKRIEMLKLTITETAKIETSVATNVNVLVMVGMGLFYTHLTGVCIMA